MCFLNHDLIYAKEVFDTGKYTCVLCKNDTVLTSKDSGVQPLVAFVESGRKYTGFSAADKIVGKAAAHLYILMDVIAVYASVMSKDAVKLLSVHHVKVSYDTLTDSIINRTGNDICPMEKAVSGIDDSAIAFRAIQTTLAMLRKYS